MSRRNTRVITLLTVAILGSGIVGAFIDLTLGFVFSDLSTVGISHFYNQRREMLPI